MKSGDKYRHVAPVMLVGILLLVLAGFSSANGAYIFNYEDGMEGWEPDHQITCGDATPPCEFVWGVQRSTEQAKQGRYSLRVSLDGRNDDGTVWIERPFSVPSTVTVNLSFWLWSPSESQANRWPVLANVGIRNPRSEADFTIIGETDTAPGWVQHTYSRTFKTGEATRIWVGYGVGATWEIARVYYLDVARVTISSP